ncbi:pH-sensitive chloride channel 2-like isoform X2 [Eurosta solidaginis]|uniref:pH-sensitive chloride channel 2-like isoform X2 n=1 Tax=Eurosta solidaginis TaxID=178769 RepID=UPI00353076CE
MLFNRVLKMCLINMNILFVKSIGEQNVRSLDVEEAYSNTCSYFNKTQANVNCPSLQNDYSLTQTQVISCLTSPCRYDRLERPFPVSKDKCLSNQPLDISVRIHIYNIQIKDSHDLQLKIFGLIQLRYIDTRLAFGVFSPNLKDPIFGDSQLLKRIWIPYISFENEQTSFLIGTEDKDILTTIMPDGRIIISSHIQPTFSCWIYLTRFPFDVQHCSALLESWMYNSSEILLRWEDKSPIVFDKKMLLAGYNIQNVECNETMLEIRNGDLRFEILSGNFSSLRLTVLLTRDSQFYTMDYFVPSIMLVAISWVTFWLQADQTPARTTLEI